MRRFALAALLILSATVAVAPPAHAATVTAIECANNVWPCNNIIAQGTQGINDILGAGGADNVNFNFGNADVTFAGTFTSINIGGLYVAINGQGTATWNAAGAGWLDVYLVQNFALNPLFTPAIGVANEYMNGGCNAAATAGGDFIQGQLYANGTLLPVMGGAGDCAAGNFNFANGPSLHLATQAYTLAGLAQFDFIGNAIAGGAESIDLPYGDSEAVPEPASISMVGGALLLSSIAARRLRRQKAAQPGIAWVSVR